MKKMISLLLLCLGLWSCGDESPGKISRSFYLKSELNAPEENLGMYVNWSEGDKIIFRYVFDHPEEENIADDELSEIFWVEIPASTTEFEYELGTDSPYEFYYTRSCFCYFEAFEFNELSVSGQRINSSTWELSFEMVASWPDSEEVFELKDSGKYKLGQR